ncbi:serine/arginine-rich SC35-like splicing factor SCL33 isoform X2 [Raphanus sativus]|uniref:Serine/arginine-rich SC35-like splicing factor SCL33 isoform X2 n=1 Tax=Raphanus sativus TaxID=3726 RepID=A0A6J0JN76_RAPSA|nr:serine/arginine-rich SC35-like splicing factor SCL33 isoform X2 [Raphanus sativus]XP_018436280.1 serine/arginine-rich SC35-like splicing factor SCL33 isoform X2 [Raphanus sativus]
MNSSLREDIFILKLCEVSRNPRGFGFVQFVDPADAAEAKYHMDGYVLHGRELTVVFAEENRKKPTEMRARERGGVRRRSPPRYSRSPPRRRGRSRSRSGDYYSPPRRHHPRSISPREERYDRGRSYSRSPAYNGSKGRSVTPARGKSRSISPSPRRSISRSPRRSISRSRSPRGNRSPGPGRSISRSPRGNRSPSPRRSRSYTPEQARSRSPPRGEQYEDRSPSP